MLPVSECASRFRVCYQVQGVLPGSDSVLPGSECATRFRVCYQVQSVLQGSECATRFRVCYQVQMCYKVQGVPGSELRAL